MADEQRDGGGPAFPTLRQLTPMFYDDDARMRGDSPTHYEAELFDGMTLRDYFAAKALTGIIAVHKPTAPQSTDDAEPAETSGMYDAFAVTAYAIADAMLTERAK